MENFISKIINDKSNEKYGLYIDKDGAIKDGTITAQFNTEQPVPKQDTAGPAYVKTEASLNDTLG